MRRHTNPPCGKCTGCGTSLSDDCNECAKCAIERQRGHGTSGTREGDRR